RVTTIGALRVGYRTGRYAGRGYWTLPPDEGPCEFSTSGMHNGTATSAGAFSSCWTRSRRDEWLAARTIARTGPRAASPFAWRKKRHSSPGSSAGHLLSIVSIWRKLSVNPG